MPEDFTPPPLSDYRGPSRAPAASVMPPSPVTAAPPADNFTPPPLTDYKGPVGKLKPPSHPLDAAADGLLTHQTENKDRLIGSAWSEVDPQKAVYSLSNAILHPLDTMHEMGRQNSEIWQRAKDAYDKGDYTGAAAHALNYVMNGIPGVGSSLESAGQKFASGDVQGGIGHTLGLAANLYGGAKLGSKVEVPEVPDLVNNTVTSVKNGANKIAAAPVQVKSAYSDAKANLFEPNFSRDAAKAWKPAPTDSTFPDVVEPALSDVKTHGDPTAKFNKDFLPAKLNPDSAAAKAITKLSGGLETYIKRAETAKVTIPGDPIVQAVKDAIPARMWQEDPVSAQGIIDKVTEAYGGKSFSPTKFRDFLRTGNASDSPFHNKSIAGQNTAEAAGMPAAIDQTITKTIRDNLYKALDPENEGAGPREIQQRTGSVIHLRNSAERRNNSIEAEKPSTKFEGAARVIPGVHALTNPKTAILNPTSIVDMHPFTGQTDAIISRLMKYAPDAPPIPQPANEYYPKPTNAGLLPSGPIITPPPDNYSFDANAPAPPQGFRVGFPANAPAQLPAATSQIGVNGVVVPDLSGQAAQAANRMNAGPAQLPAASSPVGVSGVIAPDISGQAAQATNRMNAGPIQLPAASSPVGVSGTTVPDIIDRASRGQGTPRPLLPAPNPQNPTPNVLPPRGQDIIAPGSREWLRPIGDIGAGQSTLASPLGQTPATSHLSGVSRISTEGGISPAQINVAKSAADKMVVGQPTTLRNSSGQSVTVIKLQDGKIYTFNPNAPNVKPAR